MKKWNEQGRICTRCNEFLSWENFSNKGSKRYGSSEEVHQKLQPQCKSCSTELTKKWRGSNSRERLKHLYLQNTYGISYNDWIEMLAAQDHSCKICNCSLDCSLNNRVLKSNSAVVDHCHVTGRVRGILCNECNRGLGYFKDNADSLVAAAHYLMDNHDGELNAIHA